MALVKCEECGQMVSDKAAACPHCGAPVEVKKDEKKIICEECGQEMPESSTECPNCGCPNPNVGIKQEILRNGQVTSAPPAPKPEGKTQVAIPMILGIVAYIIITTILSNVVNDGYTYEDRIENDILYCAVVGVVIPWFVANSMIDRIVCSAVLVVVALIAYSSWEDLGVGTAVILHLANIIAVVIVAMRRKYHTGS